MKYKEGKNDHIPLYFSLYYKKALPAHDITILIYYFKTDPETELNDIGYVKGTKYTTDTFGKKYTGTISIQAFTTLLVLRQLLVS